MSTHPDDRPLPVQAVLFTNLYVVTIGSIRLTVSALLLQASNRFMIRGFGTDRSWQVFDLTVASIAYELETYEAQGISHLLLQDGPALTLTHHTQGTRVAVDVFRAESHDDLNMLAVWERLERRVQQFWDRPNMPRLQWEPA